MTRARTFTMSRARVRKIWRRPKDLGFLIGLFICVTFVLLATLIPVLSPHDPVGQDLANALQRPNASHWLGTDHLGRDVLTRMLHAARIDLSLGVLGVLLPLTVGTILGLLAGYFGGWVDTVLMRVGDVIWGFPFYILVIAIVFAVGPGIPGILLTFTVIGWVSYARLVRSQVLTIREQNYVAAARLAGVPTVTVLRRHVLPHTTDATLVFATIDVVRSILAVAALGFLGVGVPPPTPEWGTMMTEGQAYLATHWWLATTPGLLMVILGIGFSLVGDHVAQRESVQ